jgi:hypothetical protein
MVSPLTAPVTTAVQDFHPHTFDLPSAITVTAILLELRLKIPLVETTL